jgi:hypothetical protein
LRNTINYNLLSSLGQEPIRKWEKQQMQFAGKDFSL